MSLANSHCPIPKPVKSWTLIYYIPLVLPLGANPLEQFAIAFMIECAKYKFNAEEVLVYVPQHEGNGAFYGPLQKLGLELVEMVPPIQPILSIIYHFLVRSKQNVIFFRYDQGFDPLDHLEHYLDQPRIYANAVENSERALFKSICSVLQTEEIVDSNLLLVPYTTSNAKFITKAFELGPSIRTRDETLATNICLTIVNNTTPLIKFFSQTYIPYGRHKIFHRLLQELAISPQFTRNVPFDDPNFIYYPFLDIDLPPNPPDPTACIFNTNGITFEPTPLAIQSLMYGRFDNGHSGFFSRIKEQPPIIPKILHQIFFQEVDLDQIQRWGRHLQEPWVHLVWTERELGEVMERWHMPFQLNPQLRHLVASLAILEKYGGLVVGADHLPLKPLPDHMLGHKFWLGFWNEATNGITLYHGVLGSVPGNVGARPPIMEGRQPFLGINNFFKDVRIQNQRLTDPRAPVVTASGTEIVTNGPLFENLYRILGSDLDLENKISSLDLYLMTNPDVMIYPSYYFNPHLPLVPKKLSKLAICTRLQRLSERKERIRTPLHRTFEVPLEGIVSKLGENPRDRIGLLV